MQIEYSRLASIERAERTRKRWAMALTVILIAGVIVTLTVYGYSEGYREGFGDGLRQGTITARREMAATH